MALVETIATGTKISLGSTASPPVYTEIKGVHNGPNGPNRVQELASARHHGITGTIKRATYKDEGNVTFDVYYDSNDVTHGNLRTVFEGKSVRKYKMELTDTGLEIYTFDGVITQFAFKGNVGDYNVMAVTIEISGDITVT